MGWHKAVNTAATSTQRVPGGLTRWRVLRSGIVAVLAAPLVSAMAPALVLTDGSASPPQAVAESPEQVGGSDASEAIGLVIPDAMLAPTEVAADPVLGDLLTLIPSSELSSTSPEQAIQVNGRLEVADSFSITDVVEVAGLHSSGVDGSGGAIAIIDTGVKSDHPAVAGRVVAGACFVSGVVIGDGQGECPNGQEVDLGVDAGAPCTGSAGCSHGTSVAGVAAGAAVSGVGPGGLAPGANIVSVRVFPQSGSGAWDLDVLRGLDWVADNAESLNIVAVNVSIASSTTFAGNCDGIAPAYVEAFARLLSVGVIPVVAAGNNGSDGSVSRPGCVSSAVTVGAVDNATLLIARYSNRSSVVDLFAPGGPMLAPSPNGYSVRSGTSFAAPVVAGLVAMFDQLSPLDTAAQTIDRITATTFPNSAGLAIVGRLDGLGISPENRGSTPEPFVSGRDLAELSGTVPAVAGQSAVRSEGTLRQEGPAGPGPPAEGGALDFWAS